MTDPIADMLTRIRNGYMARKKEVIVPYSGLKKGIGELLVSAGYLSKMEVKDNNKNITLELVYMEGRPAINNIKRMSKPGRRVYLRSSLIPNPLSGYGLAIVTTSQGLMSGKEAKKKKLGGEIICQVW